MLDSNIQKDYHKFKEREKKYQRYARPSNLIGKYAIFLFISIFLITSFSSVLLKLVTPLSQICTYVPPLVWFVFVVVSVHYLEKKARIYSLNADERVLFHACSILENLENYFDSANDELKKEHKKNIILHAQKMLSTIENNWTIGKFELGRNTIGDCVSKFKENLRNRLIPHIEKGDEASFKTVGQIMYNFTYFLRSPSIEDLNHLNKSISEKIDSYPSAKIGFFGKCSNLIKTHKIFRNILAIASMLISCYFVYLLGSYISAEAGYVSAVSLFGILLVGYWQYTKK
jgi:hypothetical protein